MQNRNTKEMDLQTFKDTQKAKYTDTLIQMHQSRKKHYTTIQTYKYTHIEVQIDKDTNIRIYENTDIRIPK